MTEEMLSGMRQIEYEIQSGMRGRPVAFMWNRGIGLRGAETPLAVTLSLECAGVEASEMFSREQLEHSAVKLGRVDVRLTLQALIDQLHGVLR